MPSEFEKYGVDESSDAKTASRELDDTARVCPNCGSKLEPTDKVNVLKCPQCGTLPFEHHE